MSERTKDLLAGGLAIGAGFCWFAWAITNTLTSHRLEQAPPGTTLAAANALLTAGWNLLLVPAALRLYQRFRGTHPRTLLAATAAGLVSVSLWAVGGFSHISRALETSYLALAAVWLLVLGTLALRRSTAFGRFTLVVGAFTALDSIFNLFEPVPFALYLLAAPKLPLAAIWSVTAGVLLVRDVRDRAPNPSS